MQKKESYSVHSRSITDFTRPKDSRHSSLQLAVNTTGRLHWPLTGDHQDNLLIDDTSHLYNHSTTFTSDNSTEFRSTSSCILLLALIIIIYTEPGCKQSHNIAFLA